MLLGYIVTWCFIDQENLINFGLLGFYGHVIIKEVLGIHDPYIFWKSLMELSHVSPLELAVKLHVLFIMTIPISLREF